MFHHQPTISTVLSGCIFTFAKECPDVCAEWEPHSPSTGTVYEVIIHYSCRMDKREENVTMIPFPGQIHVISRYPLEFQSSL
jgi:hypothetical protein